MNTNPNSPEWTAEVRTQGHTRHAIAILDEWDRQTADWEEGRTTSPSTTDRFDAACQVLGVDRTYHPLADLADDLYDRECWSGEPLDLALWLTVVLAPYGPSDES